MRCNCVYLIGELGYFNGTYGSSCKTDLFTIYFVIGGNSSQCSTYVYVMCICLYVYVMLFYMAFRVCFVCFSPIRVWFSSNE